MNLSKKTSLISGLLLVAALSSTPFIMNATASGGDQDKEAGGHKEEAGGHSEEEGGHKEEAGGHKEEGGGHDEKGVVKLSALQMTTAGITVKALLKQQLSAEVRAAGEVQLNAYSTVRVSPRIAAQVISRQIRLGDTVIKGQALVTLSSVEMAAAQSELLLAEREWSRVRKLGRKVVSDRRYTEANVKRQTAYAKVQAYGMTSAQANKLLRGSAANADGTFQLLATQDGTVISDDFIEGQIIEPGKVLITLTDESSLWVESSLTPQQASNVQNGASARIKVADSWIPAKVIQLHHLLNEKTRTLAVRLKAPNEKDQLHPGQFVDAYIETNQSGQYLALPEAAVLRSADGDWQIMVEQDEAGEFKAVEIELIRVSSGMAIIEGIKPGTRVVTKGAFFVQSELAKSGFSIHNH